MMVVYVMNLGWDDKVLDVCSVFGGKVCYMVEIFLLEGYVDVIDIYEYKINFIK